MFRIILTKIAAGLLTTLGVSIVIFLGTNALPGDAAQIRLGQAATEDSLRALREELGSRAFNDILSEKRNDVTKNIRDQVNIKARTLGMDIIDIQIRRADYPEVTSQAIFARMIAERERIAREFRATGEEEAQKIRASAEKQRVVTVAEGARKSQEIRGSS